MQNNHTQIQPLTPEVIAQIAAGQVVEQPASIVKELVENSLDAGALSVSIELQKAGKEKIIVTDTGCGMSQADLEVCYKHHTTSKISHSTDLLNIETFGFRGEALSSVSAVATLSIASKQEKQLAGKYVDLVAGKVVKSGSVGMPVGTRVVVSGLFATTPARKKFLHSDAVEFSYSLHILTSLALAHTHVAFKLIHNKKIIFDLPSRQPLLERCAELLSVHVAQQLLPITLKSAHFSLTGFIGKPQLATPSKQRQFLFVNNRVVQSKEVSGLLKRVFSTLLEPRSYPCFILSVTLAANLVDVNVDPQKTRVKFLIEQELLEQLEFGVQKVLLEANLTYTQRGANGFYEEYSMDFGLSKALKEQPSEWNIKSVALAQDTAILQVHNLYLFAQTQRGIVIIDQHAAHERILYEEFLQTFTKKRAQILALPKPIELQLPVSEQVFLQENIKLFTELGFTIVAHNEAASARVTHIPKLFKTRNIPRLIQELLHDCIAHQKPKELDVGTHRTLSYLACRSAIKAGEVLTPEERESLVQKILTMKGSYTCPHGRPALVELDIHYLDQLFKRSK